MTYDCFSFFNELDLLEIRLNSLDKVVDRFVISESNFTHRGIPKPLYYKDNESRFSRFKSKIIHVVSPDPDDPERAKTDVAYGWLCENRQRNATIRAIEGSLHDDDILIVSDLDEIPNPAAILKAIKLGRPVRLRQKLYCYYLNYRCYTTPYWDTGSVVLSYKSFCSPATYLHLIEGPAVSLEENSAPTATKVRALLKIKTIRNGGWHFSYIGGIEKILTKISSIVEGREAGSSDNVSVNDCIQRGSDLFHRGEWFFADKASGDIPQKAMEFPELFFKVDNDYLRSVRFKKIIAYLKRIGRPLAWKILPHHLATWLSQRLC